MRSLEVKNKMNLLQVEPKCKKKTKKDHGWKFFLKTPLLATNKIQSDRVLFRFFFFSRRRGNQKRRDKQYDAGNGGRNVNNRQLGRNWMELGRDVGWAGPGRRAAAAAAADRHRSPATQFQVPVARNKFHRRRVRRGAAAAAARFCARPSTRAGTSQP